MPASSPPSPGIKSRLVDYLVDAAVTAPEVARRFNAYSVSFIGEGGDIAPAKMVQIIRAAVRVA